MINRRTFLKSIGVATAFSSISCTKNSLFDLDSSTMPQFGMPYRASLDELQWFRDAKFGMFIHWGPVSLTGAELSWSRGAKRPFDVAGGGSPSETGWTRLLVPGDEYDNLYKRFNPVKFDADQWAQIAKDAGMKYIVFTAKHHDGFSNFHTEYSDYNIKNTPFKRDIVKELANACHCHGLKFGIYYSQRDWYHHAYLKGDNREYQEFMFGQIRELLTNYGKIDIMWFDSFGESDLEKDWDIDGLLKMIRQLQPGIIVNNRLAALADYNKGPEKYWGDFDTPEQRIGKYQTHRPWESCITLVGHQWSWKPGGEMFTKKECIDKLVMSVCGDGNMLLNVGPMPTGEIEKRQVDLLKEVGDWQNKYGESIYGTRGGPIAPDEWGGVTHTKDNIYLHVLKTDQDKLIIPSLPVSADYTVLTPDRVRLSFDNRKITIFFDQVSSDSYDIIIKLKRI